MSATHTPPSVWFNNICRNNGVYLTSEQLDLLERFVSLLLHTNKDINLLSRKDEDQIWEHHILHSISPMFRFSFSRIESILDLGTGGGLPGIPLKILLPSVSFILIDSIHKKAEAVENIIHQLKLPDVSVICLRVEDLAKKREFNHKFDAVICRAVAPLKKLVSWSFPLLRKSSNQSHPISSSEVKIEIPRGSFLAFKGGDLEKEIEEARRIEKLTSIHEIPLVFHGSEALSLVDKKIVLVQF